MQRIGEHGESFAVKGVFRLKHKEIQTIYKQGIQNRHDLVQEIHQYVQRSTTNTMFTG